jgi:hypothetical protein
MKRYTSGTIIGGVLLFVLFFAFHCSLSHKTANKEKYPFEIRFGSTGGFSNINPIFIVKHTGEVLKKDNSSAEPNLVRKISKQKTDSIYQLIKDSNFSNLTIKHTSNLTHYIEIQSDKFTNKVMWFNESQIPEELKKLNDILLSAIKN